MVFWKKEKVITTYYFVSFNVNYCASFSPFWSLQKIWRQKLTLNDKLNGWGNHMSLFALTPWCRERMMAVVYAGPWPTIEGNKPEEFWNFSFAKEPFHHFFSLLVVLIRSTRWLVCPIYLNCACWRREKDAAQCWVSFGRQTVCLSRSLVSLVLKKSAFFTFLAFDR